MRFFITLSFLIIFHKTVNFDKCQRFFLKSSKMRVSTIKEDIIMDELKKVLLAGIGLTSMTLEKADAFVKEMVAKGRLTVEEGKELQSELKRKGQEEVRDVLDKVNLQTQKVQYATKEDLSRLEDKLDALLRHLGSDNKE
jgi:hypothetical protein